jgi:hypothetical protein
LGLAFLAVAAAVVMEFLSIILRIGIWLHTRLRFPWEVNLRVTPNFHHPILQAIPPRIEIPRPEPKGDAEIVLDLAED